MFLCDLFMKKVWGRPMICIAKSVLFMGNHSEDDNVLQWCRVRNIKDGWTSVVHDKNLPVIWVIVLNCSNSWQQVPIIGRIEHPSISSKILYCMRNFKTSLLPMCFPSRIFCYTQKSHHFSLHTFLTCGPQIKKSFCLEIVIQCSL